MSDIRSEFRLLMETNVTSPTVVATSFRPLLLRSSNPYSICASSGARIVLRNAIRRTPDHAQIGNQSHGAYQISKAALNILAVLQARDFGDKRLKVFAMSPGFVRSNLRGESEEARSGWGRAGDPDDSERLLLNIGGVERDEDVGCLVHKDGVLIEKSNWSRYPSKDYVADVLGIGIIFARVIALIPQVQALMNLHISNIVSSNLYFGEDDPCDLYYQRERHF
ncbi:short-chain dehydrogenase, putative [Talaromyces stipitatus ATCC 10500]|uniref:Short-chain dehydrogenase, putative n=1 Tax=Talaromyces stipitatus (strain ATCC 10500 / CBS 375.48 / QM 6759 / NRRL 1006) TaxID=441959 RepID=B8LVU8_TALSN|nr:short-chain dehydrogenase, putative [Talaromyces stipitatus ATCC 10500]EED24314.1 short-chain dehydrogenase, putative [Talaromyces stipitatus ATCC 10500]